MDVYLGCKCSLCEKEDQQIIVLKDRDKSRAESLWVCLACLKLRVQVLENDIKNTKKHKHAYASGVPHGYKSRNLC